MQQFAGRVLALDTDTLLAWGRLAAHNKRRGATMSVMDSLIAATELHHKMVLVTRNAADFTAAGVSLFDPWE
jgi:predicted nucleic acid-binding protein